jgi:hypothetical protein
MKILNLALLFVSFLFFGCNLEPLPLETPKDSFDLVINPPSGYTASPLVDGVQLKNGDFIVLGKAVKSSVGDIFLARFDKEGKQILKSEVFDAGKDEDVSNLAIDNDENIYVAGSSFSTSSTNAMLAKFSTKDGNISKLWIKTQEYGVQPNNSWFARVLFDNGQLYIVEGLKFGNNTSNYGLLKLDTEGIVQSSCTSTGKIPSLVTLDATILNSKIYVCGHTAVSKSTQLSWMNSSLCTNPTRLNYSLTSATGFDAARAISTNGTHTFILSNDQSSSNIYKPIIMRTDINALTETGSPRRNIDPTTFVSNLKSYQGKIINQNGSNALLYLGSYSINSDNQEYTDFRKIEVAAFGDIWATLKTHKLTSEQVLAAQDGGYLLIGKSGDLGKVVKTNSGGDCSNCK